ncbi:SsrA-binding protein SmpB [bacterium]|nr:SsrA-binding protein SmpB [bacterium]
MALIAENKKAQFSYHLLEKFKAGIVLEGQEVKSVKMKRISIRGAFVILKNEEVFLIGAVIPPYQPENLQKEYNPQRTRKLLLKKSEIRHLIGKSKQKGLTMIPLKVYTERGIVKIEFALARGKKKFDKREKIKKRDIEREIKRTLKEKLR